MGFRNTHNNTSDKNNLFWYLYPSLLPSVILTSRITALVAAGSLIPRQNSSWQTFIRRSRYEGRVYKVGRIRIPLHDSQIYYCRPSC